MKTTMSLFFLFFSTAMLFSQYSIRGLLVAETKPNSFAPFSKTEVRLLEQDKTILTDENGAFAFTDLQPGKYSIFIYGYNKVIVITEVLSQNVQLAAVHMVLYFGDPAIHDGIEHSPKAVRDNYANNGKFMIDNVTPNYYEDGLYQEGAIRTDPQDTLSKMCRTGEWKFEDKNLVLHYLYGKYDGKIVKYNDNKKTILYEGFYKDGRRDGEWIYYNDLGKIDFKIKFMDGFALLNQTDADIKKYNKNKERIYDF